MRFWITASTFTILYANILQLAQAASRSTQQPINDLPFDVSEFTKSVASVQNTYCGSGPNTPGISFGDQTLLYAIGNGNTVQRCNIYHSTSLGIVVAYEGTNASSLYSIQHDLDFPQVPADPALGLPINALVFQGFQSAWAANWNSVKQALYKARKSYPQDTIFVTGHSLGGAQALLGALSIHKEFGDIIHRVITYGGPRVGNPAFADAFDAIFLSRFTGVTNGADWVSSVPSTDMGYWHPSGMVWINPANTTSWKFYPGQENIYGPTAHTPEYVYPNSVTLYFGDHQGIYMHSSMGTTQGPCPAEVGGY